MSGNLTPLSRIIIQHPEVSSFAGLLDVIRQHGREGAILLHIDLKPDFPDTPRNWELLLEAAFSER